MRVYFIVYMLLFVFTPVLGQDSSVVIRLLIIDTTYYNHYAQVDGQTYQFQNKEDSNYLELSQSLGSFDMGTVSCSPQYQFKSRIENGRYAVYIDSLLHEEVTYKNNKRKNGAVSYEYQFIDNEIGWSYERDTMQFTPKHCRRKRNTFNVVVFKKTYIYKDGIEVDKEKVVFTKKRRLCRLTFNRVGYIPLNFLIHRELRKKHKAHRKVKRILL